MRNFRNTTILLVPFILLIITNEYSRTTIKDVPYTKMGVAFINPEMWSTNTCSWACHNSSAFCEAHHIRYARPIKTYIDPIYFGIINALKSTGNYGLANVIFLVIGWPLIMWYTLIRCLDMRTKLKELRHGWCIEYNQGDWLVDLWLLYRLCDQCSKLDRDQLLWNKRITLLLFMACNDLGTIHMVLLFKTSDKNTSQCWH